MEATGLAGGLGGIIDRVNQQGADTGGGAGLDHRQDSGPEQEATEALSLGVFIDCAAAEQDRRHRVGHGAADAAGRNRLAHSAGSEAVVTQHYLVRGDHIGAGVAGNLVIKGMAAQPNIERRWARREAGGIVRVVEQGWERVDRGRGSCLPGRVAAKQVSAAWVVGW